MGVDQHPEGRVKRIQPEPNVGEETSMMRLVFARSGPAGVAPFRAQKLRQ